MADFRPHYMIMHDYGGTPKNQDGMFNPYNALVFPDGSVRYRNPENPYGEKAPHAFKLNGDSVGLSYADQVGSTPTPQGLQALQAEYDRIQKQYPGIQPLSHGEAYNATKGTDQQASKDGRDLDEASWRSTVRDGRAMPYNDRPSSGNPDVPTPIAQRGITAFARGNSQPVDTAQPAKPSFLPPDTQIAGDNYHPPEATSPFTATPPDSVQAMINPPQVQQTPQPAPASIMDEFPHNDDPGGPPAFAPGPTAVASGDSPAAAPAAAKQSPFMASLGAAVKNFGKSTSDAASGVGKSGDKSQSGGSGASPGSIQAMQNAQLAQARSAIDQTTHRKPPVSVVAGLSPFGRSEG